MGSNASQIFTERPFWAALPGAWHPLCGSFNGMGWSFEWHDFESATRVEWGKSFHPQGLEVCLNLATRRNNPQCSDAYGAAMAKVEEVP